MKQLRVIERDRTFKVTFYVSGNVAIEPKDWLKITMKFLRNECWSKEYNRLHNAKIEKVTQID